jgi:hypothetical protein
MQPQSVCHDPLPWLISVSLDFFHVRYSTPTSFKRGGDGERLGQITIGRFTEIFGCYPARGQSVRSMASRWRTQLRRLVGGDEPAVALDTGGAAWILYRVGKRCYIQQRYFLPGVSREIGPRRTHTDEEQRISEWSTTVAEVAQFATPRSKSR